MRRFILAGAAIGALAIAALAPALASADVQRYQTQTATFTVTQPAGQWDNWSNVWTHVYTVNFNPCDGTFTGTGVVSGNDGSTSFDKSPEKITGSYANGYISFTATRDVDGVSWTLAHAKTDGTTETDATTKPTVSWRVEAKVSPLKFTATSDYKNHGDYVSAMGGGADAAHSCIGMPINSNS